MSAAAASRDITLVGGLLQTLQLLYMCESCYFRVCPPDVCFLLDTCVEAHVYGR